MQHLDEGTIHAWLDGELPSAEREAAEAHIAQCEACAAAVAEARGFIAASSRILMALDAVPGGVLPARETPTETMPRIGARIALPRIVQSRAWMAAAAVLVLSTVTVIATRMGSKKPLAELAQQDKKGEVRAEAPLATPPVAASTKGTQPVPAPSEKPQAVTSAAKASTKSETASNRQLARAAAERKDAGRAEADTQPTALAQAAPAAPAARFDYPAQAKAQSPAREVRERANAAQDSYPVGAVAGKAPRALADSAPTRKALALQQIVVTGQGVVASAEKLGAVNASYEPPRIVSRNSTIEGGDTVVTTIYMVHGELISLIDRPSARDEVRRAGGAGFSDKVAAQARDATPVNSITWSDSAGRMRTLRGAMSQAELERVKRALFGPTP